MRTAGNPVGAQKGDTTRRCRGDVDVAEEGWAVGCGCCAAVSSISLCPRQCLAGSARPILQGRD